MDTRTGMLQKRLAVDDRSGGSEGMNAVDLDGHCLDIAVSDDGGSQNANLLWSTALASSVSAGQASRPRGPPVSHENLNSSFDDELRSLFHARC